MSLNGISLTAGMRNNLLSLQNTSASINRTQERLSSGKKVNSPLDNPTNFFAAQSHINRAIDLSGRMDSVREAIRNIYAANSGITAITSLLDVANGLANAALFTSNLGDRAALSLQFDGLLDQIDTLAADSIYRGANLLNNDTLTVDFAEATGDSTLTIAGVDATHTGLGVDKVNSTTATTDVANMIAAGNGYSLAIKTDGTVSAWGDLTNPGAQVPAGLTDVVSIKSGADELGRSFSVALKSDGTVVAWGDPNNPGSIVPEGLTGITSISAGQDFVLAVKDDGTVAAWGGRCR